MLRGLAERVKVQAERPNIHGYEPHEKQIQFHSAVILEVTVQVRLLEVLQKISFG
jgi:hypothetical protein